MWRSIELTGSWRGEIWNRRRSGEIYPEWLSITTVKDTSGHVTQYVGTFSDLTERKRIEEERVRLALHGVESTFA
jgi:PAS domain S-box-containing protein